MKILRATDHRIMPWKNGGGTTTEIAVHPEGAGLDSFEWRVSMATVGSDGPFSSFPGIDRTLAVLTGEGIVLDIKGDKPVTLTPASTPLSFQADVQTDATLVSGPIADLNVMTRRGSWKHSVQRVSSGSRTTIAADSAMTLLVVSKGTIGVSHEGKDTDLNDHDCAMLEQGAEDLTVIPAGSCVFFVVRLDKFSKGRSGGLAAL